MIFLFMQLLMNMLKSILKHMGVLKSKVLQKYVASNVINQLESFIVFARGILRKCIITLIFSNVEGCMSSACNFPINSGSFFLAI